MKDKLMDLDIDELMSVFPQNLVFWCDSGLFAIYTEEGFEIGDDIYSQGAGETFQEFIARALADLYDKDKPEEDGWCDLKIDIDILLFGSQNEI